MAGNVKDVSYSNWDGKKKVGSKRYGESKLGVMLMGNALNRRIVRSENTLCVTKLEKGYALS